MELMRISGKTFQKEVLQSKTPVVCLFWAAWSAPCKTQLALLEQRSEREEQIRFCRINTDEQFPLSLRYLIRTVPTVLVFREGKLCRKAEGPLSEAQLSALLAP